MCLALGGPVLVGKVCHPGNLVLALLQSLPGRVSAGQVILAGAARAESPVPSPGPCEHMEAFHRPPPGTQRDDSLITLYLAPVRRAGGKKNRAEIPERYLTACRWLKGSEELARASFRAGWIFWIISAVISRPRLAEAPGEGLEEFRGEEGRDLSPITHRDCLLCAPSPLPRG